MDSSAEVRTRIDTLHGGDRVEILERTRNWAKIRLRDGRIGWIEKEGLLGSDIYQQGRRLAAQLATSPPQAVGHVAAAVNLHTEPSREAPELQQLQENQQIEVYARRMVERLLQDAATPGKTPVRDAWYLVRAQSQAGWVLGRMIDLDPPQGIVPYAQGINMVAWQVLKKVTDGDQQIPEYLVADRVGAHEPDFTHIRVFTWWVRKHKYVTAYVEGKLEGYFPIRAVPDDKVPHFRLRLVDPDDGHKFQKVYGMFDTIVRPIGVVDGWESDAMPELSRAGAARAGHRRSRLHRH